MPLYAKKGDFIAAPEGLWPAVCVDVVDKGLVAGGKYEPRHMVQIRWVMDATPPLKSGKPHMAVSSFGLTMGKKSKLRPFIESWRGRKFSSDEEAYKFDIESILGANCQIQIIHNGEYANVQTVVPPAKGTKKMYAPDDYIREKDRPGYVPPTMPESDEGEPESQPEPEFNDVITDDDIPFLGADMTPYQRAVIHEAIERIAAARESLSQQERELQLALDEDANLTAKRFHDREYAKQEMA